MARTDKPLHLLAGDFLSIGIGGAELVRVKALNTTTLQTEFYPQLGEACKIIESLLGVRRSKANREAAVRFLNKWSD